MFQGWIAFVYIVQYVGGCAQILQALDASMQSIVKHWST